MAGIMKFFKPTDGGGGSAKKAEQLTVGTTAREVFSPVGNIKGAQRAAARPAPENDSDVEIVGEEASAGLKRKRKDTGRTASGHRAATGNCAGVATAAQQPGQQNATSSFKDGPLAAQPCEAVAADVEMSSEAGANLAPEASSPGADAGTLLGASGSAAAASNQEQLLSPDLAAHQPTAKRQRVPEPSDQQRPSTEVNADHNSLDAPVAERAAADGADGAPGPAAMTPQPANGALPRQPDNADKAELLQQPDPQQQQQHHDQCEGDLPSASQQQQTVAADVDAAADAAAPATGGGGAVGAAANGGVGAKSGGAGPATLPPDMDLSATLESLRREQAGLEAALETEMLLPETDSGLSAVAAASEGGRLASMPTPAQLCAWLEGRTGPLSVLVSCLEPLLPPGAGADPTALRTSLVDLAQRKCYSEKEAPLDGAAASEDATPGRLWVWEVREPRKHLQGDSKDTAARKLAEAMRKRRKELRERLVAVGSALEALAAHQALTQPPAHAAAGSAVKGPSAAARRTAESRAAKAWNRLGRLADLEAVEAVYRTTSEGLMAGSAVASARKERARKAEKEKEREEKAREKEEKAREKEEKAREKEEKAREKEEKAREKEEKARQREEEARAKEAKKAQEDEAKRRAKEIAAANKAGYHSKQELQKSRNIMHSFFKRSATPAQQQDKPSPAAVAAGGQAGGEGDAGTSSAADGGGAAAASGLASSQEPQLRDTAAAAPSGGRGCSQPAGATPARERPVPTTMFDFSKVACRLPDRAVVEALDSAAFRLPLPAEQLAEELRANHGRWRQQRAARRRMIGVPPTWARRPRAPTDLRTLAAQYYGDVAALGLAPEGLRTWRRKLIAFPRKESARPPYYGSFSRNSTCVTGRRPFGRDSSLDYEVASDEEWEEEPEGESLSDSGDEADSQAGGGPGEGGEDEDDGFIVGDDHLSDDEGAQLSGDPDDPMHVDGAPAKGKGAAAAATTTATRFMDPRLQQLESAIDRVRTNNRPILLVRSLPTAASAAESADVDMTEPAAAVAGLHCRLRAEPRPGLNTGLDPGLLGALRPVVHTRCGEPGVPLAALAPPLELDVYSAYAAAAAGAAAQGPAAAAGCGYFGSGAEDGPAAAATLATGGTPGGRETRNPAALFAAGGGGADAVAPVAPGSARAPGSGARGRPHGPGLPAATLTSLAEFMSRCGDQRMEKIVEGFLATLPPNIKPPAKTKLRDAIKRLGAWSASTKRWHLQGGSVEAAVEHALAAAAAAAAAAATAAAAAAAAAAQMGTPLAAAAAVAAAASAGRGLVAAGGAMSTPTPGPALPPGLPAPTPAPHLGPLPTPLPTPSTAPGGRPLLPAPASTPLDGAAAAPGTSGAAHRPVGHQVVLPQHLLQALARLAPEATAAATPPPAAVVDADRYGSALTSASVMAAPATQQAVPAATPIVPPSLPLAQQQQQRPAHQQGNGHGGGAEAEAGGGEAMDCDGPLPAAQQQQHLLSGPGAGNQADGALLGGSGAVAAPCLPLAAPAAEPGQGENGSEVEAGRAAGTAAGGEAASDAVQTLPRPMPPPLPPLSELAILGSGHPFWAALSSWIMGGGGAAARSRRHGPSWADVSAALAVFVAGELEPRLSWVPLDLVRVLVAVCQHRSASHLRSGAFKALANVAAALAASAAPAAGAGAAAGAGTAPGSGALPRRRRGARRGADAEAPSTSGREGSPDGGDGAGPSSPSAPQRLRPTGQPSRCSPQPVSLQALVALPGLMEALRRGMCDADPDSETDKAARSAARVIAAIAGIGIANPSTACRPTHGEPHAPEQGHAADAAAPRPQPPQPAPGPALAPDVGAAAAAFRLRVVCDRDLHGALRDATVRGPGPDAPGARVVFHAHMLLALQRLARDPAAAARLLAPKTRLAREAAAAADGKPPPPPPSADLESKWGAKLVENLVAGGRGMTHDGCRKGMVNTAAAFLDLPALTRVLPPGGEEGGTGSGSPPAEDGGAAGDQAPGRGGSGGWSSVLSGNDPHAQLPAAVLTLLVSELQHSAGGAGGGCDGGGGSGRRRRSAARDDGGAGGEAADEDGGAGEDGTPPPAAPAPLSKCARARVAVALQLAERALRHLGRPGSRLQLRQADTKAAVAELLEALRDSGEVLAATYDPQLQALYTGVGSLAEELAA